MTTASAYRRPVLLWGGAVGFGLGAIVDVVLFHLIGQHHHLLSGYVDPHRYAGLRQNVFYDGVFVAVMLAVTCLGAAMLWRTVNRTAVRLSTRYVLGAVLVGAGVFNVFDGTVTHYVLGAHDVVHDTTVWNPHWIVVSLLLLGAGFALLYVADGATHPAMRAATESASSHD